MTKLTLGLVGNLIDATTAATTINSNSQATINAMNNTLSLDGTSPNQMGSSLDMNTNQIINLPTPATNNSPLRLSDLNSFIGGGTVSNIPTGGTTNQALSKNSNSNYDTGWKSVVSSASASDTSLNVSTTAGAVSASINTANPNIWSGQQTLQSPVLITPALGVASATTINKVTITAPASSAVLTIPNGVTLTGPASSGTAMTLGNAETITGVKTFGTLGNVGQLAIAGTTSGSTTVNATAVASGILTLPAVTDTLIGKATTDTLTNKTFNTASTGNVLQINGQGISSFTGSGNTAVLQTSPGLITPNIGVASATSINFGGDSLANYISSGSWTPIDSSGAGLTFTSVNARYTRIGNLAFCYGRLTFPTTANGANVIIGGLPFTLPNQTYAQPPGGAYSTAGNAITALALANTSTFQIFKSSSANINSDLSTAVLFFNIYFPIT